MQIILFGLLVCLSVALQGYFSLPLILLLVIALSFGLSGEKALVSVLLVSILSELFFGLQFGTFSLFFLCSSFLLILYHRKFHTHSLVYAGIFSFILLSLYFILYKHTFSIPSVIFYSAVGVFYTYITSVLLLDRGKLHYV